MFSLKLLLSLIRTRDKYEKFFVCRDACYFLRNNHEVLLIINEQGKSIELIATKNKSTNLRISSFNLSKSKKNSYSLYISVVNTISQLSQMCEVAPTSVELICYHCLDIGFKKEDCTKFEMKTCQISLKSGIESLSCKKTTTTQINIKKLIPEIIYSLISEESLTIGEKVGEGNSVFFIF